MKYKLLFKLLIAIVATGTILNAQTTEWAKSMPHATYMGNNVIEDRDSNVYASGAWSSGLFIVKYAHDGTKIWTKGYSGYNCVNSMCVDSSGNLYVVIMITNITINGVQYSTNTGNRGGYLFIKYDINGNIVWIKQMKPSLHLSDKMDSHGNLVASGGFADTVYLDNGIILLAPPPGRTSFFIGKFNDYGECIWAIQDEGARFSAPIITKNNEFFFKDWFNTPTITLGKGIKQVTFNSSDGMTYCAKYSSNGDLLWAKQLRTAVIAPDEYGNAYTFEFEDITIPPTAFITKYDQTGNLSWKRTKVYANAWDRIQMQCGTNGEVYLSGGFGNYMTVDDSMITGGSNYKMFLAKLDSSGNLKWITASSGAGSAGAKDIFVSGNEIFITGNMDDQNTFGSYSLNEPNGGVFTLKITDNSIQPLSVNELGSSTSALTVYPNPSSGTFMIQMIGRSESATVNVYDVLGNCLIERNCTRKTSQEINLSCQPKGIYFVELLSGNDRVVRKVSVQ